MGYGKRLDTLFALLKPAKTFADVGCDHGYAGEYMLENGLCKQAILSDISEGSLRKAETLLEKYIRSDKAVSVCGNGFFGVPPDTEEVLIAGMGGFEIEQILSDKAYGFLPENFLFQPMHDAERLRRYLLENGGYIERDFTFTDGKKFYDVIQGGKRGDRERQAYTDAEKEFGRDNIRFRPEAFLQLLERKIADVEGYLEQNVSPSSARTLTERLDKLKGVKNGEIK